MGCEASQANNEKSGGHPTTPPHVINFPPEPANRKLEKLRESTNQKRETEFQQEALDVHNEYRKEHGVLPLELSAILTEHAQTWAEVLAKRDMSIHSNRVLPDGEMIGENIYTCWSSGSLEVKARPVIRNWYNEIENYDFEKGDYSSKTANFTQIIWKETTELGIARARSNDGSVYIVANYRTTGNVAGHFETNVLPVQMSDDSRSESSASSDVSYDYYKIAALTQRNKPELEEIKMDQGDIKADPQEEIKINEEGERHLNEVKDKNVT